FFYQLVIKINVFYASIRRNHFILSTIFKMVCFVSFGVLDLARELIKVQIDRFSCNLFLSYYNAFFDCKRILRV
ncbi:TPA: hypothetical protein ACGAP6_003233, partial [Legionella pneumophila]